MNDRQTITVILCLAALYFASSAFDAWLKYSTEEHRIEARQTTDRVLAEHFERMSKIDDAILARLDKVLQQREKAARRSKAGGPLAE